MLRPRVNINITGEHKLFFDFCESCSVESSFDTFIDTATVALPNKLRKFNKEIVSYIKKGDVITIDLGYNENLERVFTGYITQFNPQATMILECEDEGYMCKRIALANKTYYNASLDTLIKAVYTKKYVINGDIPNLGTLKIENSPTMMDLLVQLKDTYGITSFFRDSVLNLQPALDILEKTTKFKTNYNILERGNLQYQEADKMATVSAVISAQEDDTEISWYAYWEGDQIKTTQKQPAGRLSTMTVPKLSSATAKQYAIDRLSTQIYSGLVGSFKAFGKPFVRHSEKIEYIDNEFTDRSGVYVCESINYTLDTSGLRQNIFIKYKQ